MMGRGFFHELPSSLIIPAFPLLQKEIYMKKAYHLINKTFEKISKVCLMISAAVLFLVVALIFVDVAMRYIFSHPIKGQQELAELGTVLVVYFGLPFATRIRSHVRVEPLTGMFPASVRNILYGILDFVITVFMAVMAVMVFRQAVNLTATPGNATLILRIPNFYIYFATALGAVLSAVEFLLDGIRYIMEGVQAAGKAKLVEGGEV